MTENRKYTDAVEGGKRPDDPSVPLDDSFADERGEILNLLLTPIKSVGRLTSKRGTVRANHRHMSDWHYAYVESGRVLYFERAVGSSEVPEPRSFPTGSMFFTPPNRDHAMLFAEDTVIYTFAKNVRTHENHEADLIRVEFVTPEVVERYMSEVTKP